MQYFKELSRRISQGEKALVFSILNNYEECILTNSLRSAIKFNTPLPVSPKKRFLPTDGLPLRSRSSVKFSSVKRLPVKVTSKEREYFVLVPTK